MITVQAQGFPGGGRSLRTELEHWYGSRAGHHDRLDLAIVERATGNWAGEVVLNGLDAANLSCGLRILLVGRRYFGCGLGTEATRLILGHAFETVGPAPDRAAGLHVQPESPPRLREPGLRPRGHQAARPPRAPSGTPSKGTNRHALQWEGTWVDAHLMAILAVGWTSTAATRQRRLTAARPLA